MKDSKINARRMAILLWLVTAAGWACFGQTSANKAALGSRTAKDGFRNESSIAAKFNSWKTDQDARGWLALMGYELSEVKSVAASKPHGEKSDVQLRIATTRGEFTEGISIKLVSGRRGFNQIDKRWLSQYARVWKMPHDVIEALRLFVGEVKPEAAGRSRERQFLNEMEAPTRLRITEFFAANKELIVSDLFEGDGPFAARWFMVAQRSKGSAQWMIKPASEAAKFFATGPVALTRGGNLRIGRITMQRKGGDGGRETANMLQFKINPAELFEAR